MGNKARLISVHPPYAIPGGEIAVTCENFRMERGTPDGVYIEGFQCRIVAASAERVLAIVPDDIAASKSSIHLESFGSVSNKLDIT
jgi:hypothetical protein